MEKIIITSRSSSITSWDWASNDIYKQAW